MRFRLRRNTAIGVRLYREFGLPDTCLLEGNFLFDA